jgi:DNA-binding transcriptional MerR regulator
MSRFLIVYDPHPDAHYSLEVAAHLAGISRRTLLIYCRLGVIQPVLQPPYDVMTFSEEAVHRVRRIEQLRKVRQDEADWIKTIFPLLEEAEHLRAEVRFFRNR